MSIMSKIRSFSRLELAALAFYFLSGVILLIYLALSGAPQLGLLGILSLIAVYGIFTKRRWTPWLLIVLLVAASTFSFYTLAVVGFSNALVGASMVGYAVLSWLSALYILLRKTPLTR